MEPTKTPIITLFLLLLFSSINSSLTHSHGFKITTRLIHRDSIYSPLYNASETTADRAERVARSSIARHDYLSSMSSKNKPPGIEAGLVLAMHNKLFFVNFSIGQPPVPQLAVLDTGSELLWVNCLPCRPCSPSSGVTFFDPLKSKTYFPRPCTKSCMGCTARGECMYEIDYFGGDHSEGVYATDQLTFRTSDDGLTTVPNVQFGCSSLLTGYDVGTLINGIMGMGGIGSTLPFGEKPLVVRLGSKFSYCVGSISDHSYPYNHLSIGEDSDLLGDSTPFFNTAGGSFFVHLVNISLGIQILNISSQVFTEISQTKGVILDSGSELIHLYTDAFDVVKAAVKKLASGSLTEVPGSGSFELCYKGSVDVEAKGFPTMGLHLANGAELDLDPTGMFVQVANRVFCLAVVRSQTLSIIGMMAQQGYSVGYDLKESKIYFQDIDCQLLEGRF